MKHYTLQAALLRQHMHAEGELQFLSPREKGDFKNHMPGLLYTVVQI